MPAFRGTADMALGMTVKMSRTHPLRWVSHANGPVQRIQILGNAGGDFFATQICAPQTAHGCRTDGTLGVGMSATGSQTKHICSLCSFESITRSSAVRPEAVLVMLKPCSFDGKLSDQNRPPCVRRRPDFLFGVSAVASLSH